jgi:hypothetical protein
MILEFMKTQIHKFNSMIFAIHAKEGIIQPLTKALTGMNKAINNKQKDRLKTTQLTKRKHWPNVMKATKTVTETDCKPAMSRGAICAKKRQHS